MTQGANLNIPIDCGPHAVADPLQLSERQVAALERAAALFRALGDVPRLRLLRHLDAGECCVTELAGAMSAKTSTLSQQLRVLHAQHAVRRRRVGKHIYYALADEHVRQLVRAALVHAGEFPETLRPLPPSGDQEEKDR